MRSMFFVHQKNITLGYKRSVRFENFSLHSNNFCDTILCFYFKVLFDKLEVAYKQISRALLN